MASMSDSGGLITNALRYFALYRTTPDEIMAKYVRLSRLTVSLEGLTYNMDIVLRRGIS